MNFPAFVFTVGVPELIVGKTGYKKITLHNIKITKWRSSFAKVFVNYSSSNVLVKKNFFVKMTLRFNFKMYFLELLSHFISYLFHLEKLYENA